MGLVANSQRPDRQASFYPTGTEIAPLPSMFTSLSLLYRTLPYYPGHALQIGIQRKLTSNLPHCRAAGIKFVPFVMESLGGLYSDAVSFVRSIKAI